MAKTKPRTINVHLPEDVHRLLRTLAANSGLTYAKVIELALGSLDTETRSRVRPEVDVGRTVTVAVDVPDEFIVDEPGLTLAQDPPASSEGASSGNAEAASSCAAFPH